MGRLVFEVERLDFIPSEWELYQKGYKSINNIMLTPPNQIKMAYCDEAYIILGKDKHKLK